jgi:general secretion pathway protein G
MQRPQIERFQFRSCIVVREATVQAFTLVELLIVVVILGILAAIIIPQFSDASADAKTSALTSDLAMIRKQIGLYRLQHNGSYPPFNQFEVQMTSKSNPDGSFTGAPAYGPYLKRIPINPFTDGSDLGTGSCGTSSWYYDETTGEFRPNCHAAHCPL